MVLTMTEDTQALQLSSSVSPKTSFKHLNMVPYCRYIWQ